MGNKSSLMLQDEEINAIQNETGCKYLQLFFFFFERKIYISKLINLLIITIILKNS